MSAYTEECQREEGRYHTLHCMMTILEANLARGTSPLPQPIPPCLSSPVLRVSVWKSSVCCLVLTHPCLLSVQQEEKARSALGSKAGKSLKERYTARLAELDQQTKEWRDKQKRLKV